jgi:uncharacterized coiled-coil protein SlyX
MNKELLSKRIKEIERDIKESENTISFNQVKVQELKTVYEKELADFRSTVEKFQSFEIQYKADIEVLLNLLRQELESKLRNEGKIQELSNQLNELNETK